MQDGDGGPGLTLSIEYPHQKLVFVLRAVDWDLRTLEETIRKSVITREDTPRYIPPTREE